MLNRDADVAPAAAADADADVPTTTRVAGLPRSVMLLLFAVSAAQNMSTSLLTLLFSKSLEPQQTAYFWLFMSWIYWASPVAGWVSDICGNRKALLVVGIACVMATWCMVTWLAHSFATFVAFGALQNASMMFVNAAINGTLVEVSKMVNIAHDANSGDGSGAESSVVSSRTYNNDDDDAAVDSANENVANEFRTRTMHVESADTMEAPLMSATTTTTRRSDGSGIGGGGNDQSEDDDAAVDAVVVEGAHRLTRSGDTQSTAMLARSLGSVIGAVVQTFALSKMDIRDALAISIALYGLSAVVAVFADFTPQSVRNLGGARARAEALLRGPNVSTFMSRIGSLFARLRTLCSGTSRGRTQRTSARDVVVLLGFIFMCNMLPDATTFYYSYVFDQFTYPNWFNSLFQLVNLLGALAACEVYRRWLAPLSQTKVFVAGCACAAASYLTGVAFCTGFTRDVLHMDNAAFLMIDSFVVGFLNRMSFLPVVQVAGARCPKGFEAVVFELFSLAAMGGSTVSYLISIHIANALGISRAAWGHLWVLMAISAVARFLPIFVVPHLPPPAALVVLAPSRLRALVVAERGVDYVANVASAADTESDVEVRGAAS